MYRYEISGLHESEAQQILTKAKELNGGAGLNARFENGKLMFDSQAIDIKANSSYNLRGQKISNYTLNNTQEFITQEEQVLPPTIENK